MLSSPALPPRARVTILTYIEEKLAGLYGHNKTQLRRFAAGFDPCNRGHSLFTGNALVATIAWIMSGWFSTDNLLGTATASNASRRTSSIKMRAANSATTSHVARFTAGRFSFRLIGARLGFFPVGPRGGRLLPERHPPAQARRLSHETSGQGCQPAPLRRHAARVSAYTIEIAAQRV